jgi:hypothetical protein
MICPKIQEHCTVSVSTAPEKEPAQFSLRVYLRARTLCKFSWSEDSCQSRTAGNPKKQLER